VDCLTLRVFDILRNPIYVLMLTLLGLTFLVGQHLADRSAVGRRTIQPSEPAKILTVVVLAKFLADHEERMERFSTVLVSIAVVAVPMLMIHLQPDLGTSLTLVAIWIVMIWTAKIRLRHLLLLAVAGAFMLPAIWLGLEDYMRERLMLFD
jgi:rod shape determining protein RodA